MKLRLSVLAAAVLLLAALQSQAVSVSDSPDAPSPQTPLTLLSSDAPPAVPSDSPVCAPLPSGAVAWWRAESNTVDTIGINDLLFIGPLPLGLPYPTGKVGAAFGLNPGRSPLSATNYLVAPPSADLDVGGGAGLTIEGWLSPKPVPRVQPVAEWNDGHGNIGAGLALNGLALEAILTDTTTSPARRVVFRSAPDLLALSAWHHVALTFDHGAGQATAYVDGVAVAQTNLGPLRPATQAPLYLGLRPSGTNAPTYYSGTLDEFTIYNRALTVAELQSIVAADTAGKCGPPPPSPVPPPAGIVGWWRGESNVLDSVDANNGVIVRAVSNGVTVSSVSYVDGVVGQGFQLQGGYVRIPATTNLDVGLGPGFTLEAWASHGAPNMPITPKLGAFIGWYSTIVTQGVSLYSTNITGPPPLPYPGEVSLVWQANVTDTQGRSHVITSPEDLETVGIWQHVALTYDKASGMAVLYLNSNPVSQTNLGSFTPQTAADLDLGYLTHGPWPIPVPIATGALDEASLYARALSAAEIRSIMLARGAGKSKDPPVILSQPASLKANIGGTATFTVTAGGNPILKYQWRQSGTVIPNATASTFVLTNVQSAQAGTYSVRITNAFGVALSSNVLLTINLPPVADASATHSLAIAPLHCDAAVVLDGSRSSDPDGDPLRYSWFKAGAATRFATGMVAVVKLPAGVQPLILVVDDGLATNSQSFTVHVLTLAQAVERLIALVISEAPRPRALIASLCAALDSICRSSATPAINQLEAFQNKTRAQLAADDPALAEALIQTAQQLVAILTSDCWRSRPHARIGKVTPQPDGKLRMHFSAPQGFVYILEASTNLVDWERIGVATDGGSGEFDVEDLTAPQTPARFYRLIVP